MEECPYQLSLEDDEWQALDWIVVLLQSIDTGQSQNGLSALIKVRDYCHDAHNQMHDLAEEANAYMIKSRIPADARNN